MPPDDFLWQYPRPLAPFFQLILPRARDGDSGVVDYDGRLGATALCEAARRVAGPYPPKVPDEKLDELEEAAIKLRDELFELSFVEDKPHKKRGADDDHHDEVDLSADVATSLASCRALRKALARL